MCLYIYIYGIYAYIHIYVHMYLHIHTYVYLHKYIVIYIYRYRTCAYLGIRCLLVKSLRIHHPQIIGNLTWIWIWNRYPAKTGATRPALPPAEAWDFKSANIIEYNREARSPCFYKARLVTKVKSLLLLSATYCDVCKLLLRMLY